MPTPPTPTRPPPTGEVSWLWTGLWGAAALPLALYGALFSASRAAVAGLVAQCLLVAALGYLRPPTRAVRWGLLAALALFLAGGLLEGALARGVWLSSDKSGLAESVSQRLYERVSGVGRRSWHTGAHEAATLSFEARLAAGQAGWDWARSHPGFELEPLRDAEGGFTRISAPAGVRGYLMRTFDLGQPLGGELFRVVLELRDPNGPPRRAPRPAIERGEPVGARRCRGVALAAWAPGGGGRCLPVTLDREWARYSLSWRVPEGVASSVVRLFLSDFGGSTLDVRRVQLYWHRRPVGPLIPQGAALQIAWPERPEAHSGYAFVPTEVWERHELPLTRGPAGEGVLTATLRTGSGLVVETRNVALTAPDGTPLPAAASSPRRTLVFGDPNLAGHTAAALGLALLSLASPPLALAGALASLLSVALTGSRAAWLGVLVGVPWLLLLALARARRTGATWTLLAPLCGAGALLLVTAWGPLQGGARRIFSLHEVTARSDIWAAAWEALRSHPLRGLGAGGFAEFWAQTRAGGEAVQHAHNAWLELSAAYGLFGVAAALILLLGLPYAAWRLQGGRGAALVAGVFAMNLLDTTLFYAGVLLPLALALTAHPPPRGLGHRSLQRPSVNRGIIGPGGRPARHRPTDTP
ncbi:O-antigen ligase family protein [Truepera radiovictrix]|uniref:O-antigen ligase family protein n=1 Tax=Truepera radiovictrix TaxID=332249 RepID=UPI0011D0AB97|nr:O-antigen ligase family protein [Truepera radiovictrix]WMT58412.1 O-antigen ligase family protein [Truepera radiovictrix]